MANHSAPPTAGTPLQRFLARPHVVVGGVYGAVLGSSMTAALTKEAAGDRRYDATWLLITAVVTAAAHGYAHLIATRAQRRIGAQAAVHTVVDEWPLTVGALPSVVLLFGAGVGWWGSRGIEYVTFAVNIVLLFGWGLFAARTGGRTWLSALFIGVGDALLGLVVVLANALVK
ncbi:hypothetical protein AB0C76_36665 [Kitasatospora sp. NPDC048722]|uniref:hypothetical protein n=1 Tax=Kitasatospora sp. NPDC048722 TaxID=3155639 RepID=UPI0033C787B0